MKNNIVLYIHDPLAERHLDLCLQSLFQKQEEEFVWNNFYIYNAGSIFSNVYLLNKIKNLNKNNFFYENIKIIPYDSSSKKTLAQDLYNIFSFYNEEEERSNILLLKIDYSISKNFHSEIKKLQNEKNFMLSLPVYNAKEWLTDIDINNFFDSNKFFKIDLEDVYYRGSDCYEPRAESGRAFDEISHNIKFILWGGAFDYNCHYFDSSISKYFYYGDTHNKWGGVHNCFIMMKNSGVNFISNRNSYCIHTFHEVNTKNNNSDRGDERKIIKGERY